MKRFPDIRTNWIFARRLVAGLAAGILLVSQVALAAHACSMPVAPPISPPEVSVQAHDCDCLTDDAGAAALCKQHCENGQQTTTVKPFVSDPPLLLLASAITPPLPPSATQTSTRPDFVSGAPPPVPPFLRSSVLRI